MTNITINTAARSIELSKKFAAAAAKYGTEEYRMEDANYFYWDELEQLEERYGRDAVIDALYYAQEENEEMLHDQEDYFLELLRHDEFEFYVKRMMGITNDW